MGLSVSGLIVLWPFRSIITEISCCIYHFQEKESWDMNTEEKIEAAGKKKEEGNALFKSKKYARASKRYEKVFY